MYAIYTDELLLAGPDQEEIEQIIEDLKIAKFIFTAEIYLQYFLRVNIERQGDKTINLMHADQIYQIVTDLQLYEKK